jgi:Ni,Fe-hydrogenase I cytochrome b subunit
MVASAKGTVQTGCPNVHKPTKISAHFPHTYIPFLNLISGFCTTQSPMQATIRELVKPFNHNTYHKCDIIQLKFYFVLNRHISPYSKNIHYNPMIVVLCSVLLDFS